MTINRPTIYKCDICGKESENRADVMAIVMPVLAVTGEQEEDNHPTFENIDICEDCLRASIRVCVKNQDGQNYFWMSEH